MITADILGERARLTPERTALVYVPTGERISYGELDRRARHRAAHWIHTLGLRPSDRIGILSAPSPAYVECFFAAAKSGVVLVPLNSRLAAPELAAIIDDCGMSALLVDAEHAAVPIDGVRRVSLDEVSGEGALAHRPAPEDLLCLLYTSGTTGKPKGVMIPHRMAAWNAYNTAASWGLREDDIVPVFTPLYHAGGLAVFLTPIFLLGGSVILHAKFEAGEVWRTIERENITLVFGVPAIFQMMAQATEFATVDLGRIRWMISGGAPLPEYLIEAYQQRGVIFKQGYGMTEVGVNCFAMTPEESRRKPGSIGKPMLFTEARLTEGDFGELWLRGPHVCRGYWNHPEATAAALDAEGWFHTGDVARRDEEGFFYIAGRAKDMFISGGVNVYPAEVEAALLRHPALEEAAVIGVPDTKWGEVGCAFVVVRRGETVTEADLAAFLTGKLARYKIPAHYRWSPALPRTAYGKVVKGELTRLYHQEQQA